MDNRPPLASDAPSDDGDFDALVERKREDAWSKFGPRYEKAVVSGNINMAERIQGQVDTEAKRLAVTETRGRRARGPIGNPTATALFLGEKSATADREALARAKSMDATGADRRQILKDTGWFFDGREWQYETDDRGFAEREAPAVPPSLTDRVKRGLGLAPRPGRPLFEAYPHPEVQSALPQSVGNPRYVEAPAGEDMGGQYGQYYRKPREVVRVQEGPGAGGYTPAMVRTHEAQHWADDDAGRLTDDTNPNLPYQERRSEIRAENAARRHGMSPQERRDIPPWETAKDVWDWASEARRAPPPGMPEELPEEGRPPPMAPAAPQAASAEPPRAPWRGEGPEPTWGPANQPQYLQLPGMNLPVYEMAERPGWYAFNMARQLPMMSGYTGGPSGAVTGALKHVAEQVPRIPAAIAAGTAGLFSQSSTAGDPAAAAPPGQSVAPTAENLQRLYTQQQGLIEQRKSLDQQRAIATAERDAELRGVGRKGGRGPAYDAKEKEIGRLSGEMERLDGQLTALSKVIEQEAYRGSPEHKMALEKQAREDAEGERVKRSATPTRELYSDTLPFIVYPVAAGGALLGGFLLKNRAMSNFNTEISELSKRWLQSVERAQAAPRNSVAESAATREAQGIMREFEALKAKGDKGTRYAVELGAGLGVAGAFMPEEFDFIRAVGGDPLWQKLKETIIDDWPGTLKRAGMAAGLGGLLGHIGSLGPRMLEKPTPPGYGPATDALPPPRTPRTPAGGEPAAPQSQSVAPQALPLGRGAPEAAPPSPRAKPAPQGSAPAAKPETWETPTGEVIKRAEDGVRWRSRGRYSNPPPKGSKRLSMYDRMMYWAGYA